MYVLVQISHFLTPHPLPQPYRMINKVLTEDILDAAWKQIAAHSGDKGKNNASNKVWPCPCWHHQYPLLF